MTRKEFQFDVGQETGNDEVSLQESPTEVSLKLLCRNVDTLLHRHETHMNSLHQLISHQEQELQHRDQELKLMIEAGDRFHQHRSSNLIGKCVLWADGLKRKCRRKSRQPQLCPPSLFRARKIEWMQVLLAVAFVLHILTTSVPPLRDLTIATPNVLDQKQRVNTTSNPSNSEHYPKKAASHTSPAAIKPQIAIQSMQATYVPWKTHTINQKGKPLRVHELYAGSKSRTVSPWTSRPPPVQKLLDTNSSAVKIRHECIQKIRERHRNILGALMPHSLASPGSILLVDPAYHANVGDHMITLGELEFMKSLGFPTDRSNQCHYVQANNFFAKCDIAMKRLWQDPKYALWHGGGNWGDLWPEVQRTRVASFEKLLSLNYTIISMPESLHYSTTNRSLEEENDIAESVSRGLGLGLSRNDTTLRNELVRLQLGSRLILAWREHESYNAAMKLYPYAANLLIPDIAFQLGPYLPIPPQADKPKRVDFILLLREDKESTNRYLRNRSIIRSLLNSLPSGSQRTFNVVDWKDRLSIFKSKDFLFTETSVQLLSMGRVVITDRLHAAILAYLVGLPFVYMNQSTGKISKTLKVAFESWKGCEDSEAAQWTSAADLQKALAKSIQLLRKDELLKSG